MAKTKFDLQSMRVFRPFFFKCWHTCGVYLKFIGLSYIHSSLILLYIGIINSTRAVNFLSIFRCSSSPVVRRDRAMSCHLGVDLESFVMSHPPSSLVSKDYSSNFHDMGVPPGNCVDMGLGRCLPNVRSKADPVDRWWRDPMTSYCVWRHIPKIEVACAHAHIRSSPTISRSKKERR